MKIFRLYLVLLLVLISACTQKQKPIENDLVGTDSIIQTFSAEKPSPPIPSQGVEVVNENSTLDLESILLRTSNGEDWFIGKEIGDELKAMANHTITTDIFGGSFGPIDGYADTSLIIGWNNQNRVVYLELLDNNIQTANGLTIGATQEEVLEKFGEPYLRTKNMFRYQNSEFEIVGIIFIFNENNIVKKIVLFTYV
jgi:hypothetical protein